MPRLQLSSLFLMVILGALVAGFSAGCSGGGGTALPTMSNGSAIGSSTSAQTPALNSVATATALAAAQTTGQTVTRLSDDFSGDSIGGSATGWTVVTGNWAVCQAGTSHAYCQTSDNTGLALNGATSWTDYTITALVTDMNVKYGSVGIVGRASATQYYVLELRPQLNGTAPYWYIMKSNNGTTTALASGPLNQPDANTNFNLRMAFTGTQIVASLAFDGGSNYQVLGTVTDASFPSGQVGLRTTTTAAAHFTNVVATFPNAALPAENAVSTQSFVDSIGMNAHFESPTYANNPTQVASLISGLGVRHYRVAADQILAIGGGSYAKTLASLYTSQGIKFDVLSDWNTPAAKVLQAVQQLPAGSVEAVEGPNEVDNPEQGLGYDPNWLNDITPYMQSLYSAVKSNSLTSQATVIGPTFANITSFAAVDLRNYVDAGNMHDYFGAFNPGTNGWGANGYSFAPTLFYGSINWNMAASQQATGSKPVYATETGYYTAPTGNSVPLSVQAKYIPRLYLESFRRQVPRTYLYQLIGYNTSTPNGTLDLVSSSYVPTPAYNALAGMISIMGGNTAQGASKPYGWSISGQVTNVDHLLTYKPDGTLLIPLWIETLSATPLASAQATPLSVPPQSVTVSVSSTASTATLWTCDPTSGLWTSAPVTLSNGSVTLNVTDTVQILQLPPS